MFGIFGKLTNHNDRQKVGELECVKRWLSVYNQVNQTNYQCIRANYFQSEVDVYAYRDNETGRPLRIQVSRASQRTLAQIIEKKKNLYSSKNKADLILLIDFLSDWSEEQALKWQQENLKLLSNSGFWEVWLSGQKGLVFSLWPGLS
ncbi:MAG TPA: hypothetical protein PKN62_02580 [bacterium]|nr:hypothetical protein [bacterium]